MSGPKQGRRIRKGRSAEAASPPTNARRGRLRWLLAAVLLVLAGTAEERSFGTITDELQVLNTAIAMAEHGEIGIARGQLFAVPRPAGDAVSPYGVGLSLVELPVALAAGPWERVFGVAASQTLFVLLQVLLIAAAGGAAGLLARTLGATAFGETVAVLGTALASPLWAYQAAGFSEPLQAAVIAAAILCAASSPRAAAPRSRYLAAAAGLLAGFAVLVKAVNLALLPVLLLPLLLDGAARSRALRIRGALPAALGAAVPLGAWLAFEIARFGRPLASYGGQSFNHPPLDGLRRLLVGPSKGLLIYCPLVLVAGLGLARLVRRVEVRGTALAVSGCFAVTLLLSSAWFAWDGTVGWGPRLLVPAIPGLMAAAGAAASEGRGSRLAALALGIVGLGVNALGALQDPSATFSYLGSTPPLTLTEAEARRWPDYYLQRGPGGEPLLPRVFVAASDDAFSPIRLHAFLLAARLSSSDGGEIRRRLEDPPWMRARPASRPRLPEPSPAITTESQRTSYLTSPFSWHHLGQALTAGAEERARFFNPAWKSGVVDQVLRNLDIGRPERAERLARRLWELQEGPYHAALLAESLRAGGKGPDAARFLDGLPPRFTAAPTLAIVRALMARDRGDEASARGYLGFAARGLGMPGLRAAMAAPLSEWPKGFHGMIGENLTLTRRLGAPALGSP